MNPFWLDIQRNCPKAWDELTVWDIARPEPLTEKWNIRELYDFFDSHEIRILLTFSDWGYGYEIYLYKRGERSSFSSRVDAGTRISVENKAFVKAFLMLEEFLNENT